MNLVFQIMEITDNVIVCVNLLDEAKKNGNDIEETFAELAKEYSDDTGSASDGGLIDYFNKDDNMDEAFLNASIDLEEGKYTEEPVQSSYGYHIILKVDQKKKPKLKEVRDDVIQTLADNKLNEDASLRYNALIAIREDAGIEFNDDSLKKVFFYIQIFSQDVENFKREKSSTFNCAFNNLANINSCVVNYNSNLLRIVKQKFDIAKQKRLSKNNFFAAINVKKNSETPSTYGVPVIHKKEIKKPSVGSYKEYTIEPSLDMITYETIITEICQLGNSMERKPSLYQGKDEEGIRDFFVTMLETKFEGVTATGETFNHCGKTDILLKNAADGSNLFIAECKFWHGAKHFKESISQLFDRYLTWRDSKVALMVFVKGTNFTTAIESIHKNVVTHEYFVRTNKIRNETSSNYIFRLPQDANKEVFLEIIAFNFDKMID